MNKTVQKTLPVIFSIAGSAGVVGTSILAVKNSKKYYDSPHDVGTKAKVKEFLKFYWPSILVGAATIGSITAGTIISKKTEASLSAAVIMLERGYNKYQGKVKTMLGKDTHNRILSEIANDGASQLGLDSKTNDGKILYYNNHIGYFYAKQEDVNRALLNMNMRLNSSCCSKMIPEQEKGVCTLEQFIDEAKADIIDEEIFHSFKDFGWTYEYLDDVAEDGWIYDLYEDKKLNDGSVVTTLIFQTADPIYIPDGWDHDKYLMEQAEKWHGTYIDDIQCDEIEDPKQVPWYTDTDEAKETLNNIYGVKNADN